MMNDTENRVLSWLANGQRGISSECMAMWLTFGKRPNRWAPDDYPHDPDDFDRCLKLLEAAPGLRDRMGRLANLGPVWGALAARWSEIEASHLREVGLGWTKARSAPETYRLMRTIIEGVRS